MTLNRRSSKGSGEERLCKLLSRAGVTSRREADRRLAAGRISVNGRVVTRPGTKVDPDRDHVSVDGRRVRFGGPRDYYLLNKPTGYLTTMKDPQGRPIIKELMPRVSRRLFPVGRLDCNTSGLLIMTNDGDLASRLMHPSTACPKIYLAKVRGVPTAETVRKLSRGIVIDGRRTMPSRIRVVRGGPNAWVEIVLREGRRNQVRKMFQRVAHPVSKLRRVAIGPIRDRGLRIGGYRRLTEREVRMLREAVA